MDYKIPEDILSKIPEYFYPAFAGELVSVFGRGIFEETDDMGRALNYHSGTNGWNVALKSTCHRLDIDWLYIYYDKLTWWESDMFDGEIEDLVISKFVENEEESTHAYYLWLFGNEETEEVCL